MSTLRSLYPQRSTDALWRIVGITEMNGIDDYGSGGETGPLEIFSIAGHLQGQALGDSLPIGLRLVSDASLPADSG